MASTSGGGAHTYTHFGGAISAGGDVFPPKENVTLAAAEALCNAEPACHGVTFKAPQAAPSGPIPKVYFKFGDGHNDDKDWQTYLRDFSAVKAAAMRTADGRSLVIRAV